MTIRIIGDIHGKYEEYLNIIKDCEYSIQIGDFGFNYEVLCNVDPRKHKVLAGNHDNHSICYDVANFLPRYGYTELNGISFFFLAGAFSIDWKDRVWYDRLNDTQTWWGNEELSWSELEKALILYKSVKPDIVITHDCPGSVVNWISNPAILSNFGFNPATFTTNTHEALTIMHNEHQPKRWFFGHYHTDKTFSFKNTFFQCIGELKYYEYSN
jgi:predicted phosphodiesterase